MVKFIAGCDRMRILGIDPGIATIGFGVVDADKNSFRLIKCGVITTPAHTPLSDRLCQIYDDMCDLIDTFKPDAVSVEELFSIQILLQVFLWLMAGVLFCWPAARPDSVYMNILRCRSNSLWSDMAGLKKIR